MLAVNLEKATLKKGKLKCTVHAHDTLTTAPTFTRTFHRFLHAQMKKIQLISLHLLQAHSVN